MKRLWIFMAIFSLLYWFGSYSFFAVGVNNNIWGAWFIVPITSIGVYAWIIFVFKQKLREIKRGN